MSYFTENNPQFKGMLLDSLLGESVLSFGYKEQVGFQMLLDCISHHLPQHCLL